jgi:hypothetical protein
MHLGSRQYKHPEGTLLLHFVFSSFLHVYPSERSIQNITHCLNQLGFISRGFKDFSISTRSFTLASFVTLPNEFSRSTVQDD